jgi:hypothetical protein
VTYNPAVTQVASSATFTSVIANTKTMTNPTVTIDLPDTFTIAYMALCKLNALEAYATAVADNPGSYTLAFTGTVSGELTLSCPSLTTGQYERSSPAGTATFKEGTATSLTSTLDFPAIAPAALSGVTVTSTPSVQYREGTVRFLFPNLGFTVYTNDTIALTIPSSSSPNYYIHPIHSHCSTANVPYDGLGTNAGLTIRLNVTENFPPMSDGFYIDCSNVTMAKAHDSVTGGSASFFYGDSTSVRRGSAATLTFSPLLVPTIGSAVARVIPESLTAGSKGWLTIALRPLPVDIEVDDTMAVTLPAAWATETSTPTTSCRFSIGIKIPASSSLRVNGVFTQYSSAAGVTLTLTFKDYADESAGNPLYVHCDNIKVPAAGAAAGTAAVTLTSKTAAYGVMAANAAVTVPAPVTGAADVETVTITLTASGRQGFLTDKELAALPPLIAAAAGVRDEYAAVAGQSFVLDGDRVTSGHRTRASAEPVKMGTLTVNAKVRVPPSALHEDVLTALTGATGSLAANTAAALGGVAVTADAPQTVGDVASCWNGAKDGSETDTDCGGGACSGCAAEAGCQTGADCATGVCHDGRCKRGNAAARVSAGAALASAFTVAVIFALLF